jgi:3D (Asp-Asp-Asp) domain-containing protein
MAMRWIAGLSAALLVAIAPCAAQVDNSQVLLRRIESDRFGLPPPATLGEPVRLWATWYHVHLAHAATAGFALLNVANKPISPPIGGRDWCLGALQGVITIRGTDGAHRTYTYEMSEQTAELDCADHFRHASWARVAGRSRFGVTRGPFGDGAGGFQLVPFRTIAVDTRTFPLGTVLFIPDARGVEITLHSGQKARHDGYFFASDRGGAVKENHVDIFVGSERHNPFPSFVGKPQLHRLHKIE